MIADLEKILHELEQIEGSEQLESGTIEHELMTNAQDAVYQLIVHLGKKINTKLER